MAKRVVIAIDTREQALDPLALGRLLAGAAGAPATLVSVFPSVLLSARREGVGGVFDPAEPAMASDREALAGLAHEMGLERADAEVIPGNFVARELHHVTERPDTGLLVVGSTRRGPLGRLLIGGIGERLLQGAACPIGIAPHGYADAPPQRIERIGVGLDGSDEAQHALEGAVALAQMADAGLRIVTAFQPLAFGGVATTALPSTSANETMRTELRAIHDRAVDAVSDDVPAEGRFRDGPADKVLVDESAHVDLLMVGSRGYGPVGAVLMGSVTAALARGAACPLVVTPRGTRLDLRG